MTQAFDQRLVSVTLELLTGTFTFSGLAIFVRGQSYASAQQGQCEVTIFNMTEAQKNQVLSQASPWNLGQVNTANGQKVPVNMTVRVGRESYGLFTIFQGNVIACSVTQPPDIGVTLRGLANNYLAATVAGLTQSSTTLLSSIAKSVAASLNLKLEFDATDKQIDNWCTNGATLSQIDQLNAVGGITAFADPASGSLVVLDLDKSREGDDILIDTATGLIGVPQVTEVGVQVKTMIQPAIALGRNIMLQSKMIPYVNGPYYIYKITYEIASRAEPFWYTLDCKLPAYSLQPL